jgi:hypothetical protein
MGSGVSVVRYKINDSMWYDYTDPFDLSGYNYGDYLITYQAIDTIGNIESEHTLLVVLTEISSEPPPGIPGYNLLLVLSLMGLMSIILIRKYAKNQLKF